VPVGKSPPIGRLRNYAAVFVWKDEPMLNDPGATPVYTPAGHIWCSLKERSGDVVWGAAQILEAVGPRGTHTALTRFRADLGSRHMLEVDNIRYRVISASRDDARRYMALELEQYGDKDIIGAPLTPVAPSLPEFLVAEEDAC
jgi:Phage head-tail joining protein